MVRASQHSPAPRRGTIPAMRPLMALMVAAALAGCVSSSDAPRLDDQGSSVKGVYPVTHANIAAVRQRTVDTINARRAARGLGPVHLDMQLSSAADSHSADMAVQKRAWHFGSNGGTPVDRFRRSGAAGALIGELVSQTYESEVRTIDAWMNDKAQASLLLDPAATRVGLGVMQEESMKLWWTLVVAR